MGAKKSGSGILGKTESTITIILVLIILVWAWKTCQSDVPEKEVAQENVEITPNDYPVIFIAVDSLNMRSGASLDSMVVSKLRLGDPILYLNEKTDFRQKINFDGAIRNAPWVKVRTRTGLEGWIYAPGARFYPVD
ncbi:MAG: SH3 domain-containing protein [Bacteroidota bacterium]